MNISHLLAAAALLAASLQCHAARRSSPPIIYLNLQALQQADYTDSLQVLDVWDHLHAAATLQGVVNRRAPRLYLNYVECHGQPTDSHWWALYRRPGEWLHGRDTVHTTQVEEAVLRLRHLVKGAVVYDSHVAATSSLASTVAGVEDLVAVRLDHRPTSLYSRLVGSGLLPVRVWLVHPDGTPLFTGRHAIPDLPAGQNATTGSAKGDAYVWLLEKYLKTGRCDAHYAGYYIDQYWRRRPLATAKNHHTLTNHDYFVAHRGFFFDLSPWADEPATDDPTQSPGLDARLLHQLLSEAWRQNKERGLCHIGGFPAWAWKYTQHAGGRHQDVATEWQFSELISHYGAFKDADAIGYGALANASFWQHFPLKQSYPQPWSTDADLRQRGLLSADGRVNLGGKNFMVIYMGDYDAAAWVSQRLPQLWDVPERGRLPMMWCVSPVLAQRAPHVLHYLRATASPLDYFASADNGAGYMMPGVAEAEDSICGTHSRIRAWERHCTRFYRQWGLSVTGFIIDGNGPAMGPRSLDAYARFSPHGIVPQKCAPASLWRGMPVLQSDWDLVSDNPRQAAQVLVDRVHHRALPFHWFRCILKSPAWYADVVAQARALDPTIELLDAPTFFHLLQHWIEEQEEAEGE